MANTPVYGWETPDDTDYVYQGAAAARTTANAIDSTLSSQVTTINSSIATTNANLASLSASTSATFASSGYGVVSYFLDTSSLFVASSTETLWFSGQGFTPVPGRLYEVTYTVGNVQKTTNTGVVYVRLRKTNASGALLDIALWQSVAANQGMPFSKTITLTSAQMGTTIFAPCVTIAASNNGIFGENTAASYGYGSIIVKDIGAA